MTESKETVSSISFPIKPPGSCKVWKVIELKRKDWKTPIKFTIQEVPEDRYEEVIEHMCTYFIPQEPMCKCMNGKDDPEYVDNFRQFWREVIKQGLTVGAFTENPNGGKPIIAGVNILSLSLKGEHFDSNQITSKKGTKLMNFLEDMCKKGNIYEKYGVDKYIGAFGLSVHPNYQGVALGGHLLDARVEIGREYKLPVTATAFTSPISQKLAARCGFEDIIKKKYAEVADEKGDLLFPGIEAEELKIMGRRLY